MEEINNLKMSNVLVTEDTAMLVECLKKQSELYKIIYDTLEKLYGESQVDALIAKHFDEALTRIRHEIFDIMEERIGENASLTEYKAI